MAHRGCWAAAIAIAAATGACGDSPADDAADHSASIVGLAVTGCPPDVPHGSGVVVEAGLVLTSAHTVKGAKEIEVTDGTRTTTAEVIAFDPEMDLAYLRLTNEIGTPLPLREEADDVDRGQRAQAYVFRDGAVEVLELEVRRQVTINTEDIYIDGETRRPGFELQVTIKAGDSGGPVVLDGEVIGVLWARSSESETRAYAIDPVKAGDVVHEQLQTGDIDPEIDLTRCY